ncbi:MAG: hypothetical protein LBM13_06280 [Candidatus Ancillula sp.]|jgi:hypothetical protein|nr:hypothetical protein [Candidatus Ancillula sp.]
MVTNLHGTSTVFTLGEINSLNRRKKILRLVLIILGVIILIVTPILVFHFTHPTQYQNPEHNSDDIWVRNEGAGLYGRVNLGSLELQTKATIEKSSSFYDSQILRSSQEDFLVGSGQMLEINQASPATVDKAATDKSEKIVGNATNVITNGDWVLLLDSSGKAYRTTAENFQYAKTLGAISDNSKKVLAANITEKGTVGVLYDNGEVWKIDLNSKATKFKSQINNFANSKQQSGYYMSFSEDNWIVYWQDSTGKANKLWINGVQETDFVPLLKLASPLEKSKDIYYLSPVQVLQIDKDGNKQMPKVWTDNGYTPASIEVKDSKCSNGNPEVIAIWESNSEILSSTCYSDQKVLPFSKKVTTSGGLGRKSELIDSGDKTVLSAKNTGEVWIMNSAESNDWIVIQSTLNNWQTELDKNQAKQNIKTPDKNICPEASDTIKSFGVRPGKDNIVPVLLPVLDPNEGDVLVLVGDPEQDNSDLGEFRVINNGQALGVYVPASAKKNASTQVTIAVSDGGSDSAGACRSQITYEIDNHPYSSENLAPAHIGADIPNEHLNVALSPATSSVDALRGWYDPDGDDIFGTSATQSDKAKAVISTGGTLTFQPQNMLAGDVQVVGYTVEDSLGAKTPTSTQFKVVDGQSIYLDSISRAGIVNQPQEIDMSNYIHGANTSWILSVQNIPDGVTASVSPDGQKITVNATKAGEYTFSYGMTEASKSGSINFVVQDDADVKNSFAVSPMTAFVANNEDAIVDISNLVTNEKNEDYSVDSVQISPNLNNSGQAVGGLEANKIKTSTVRVAGYVANSAAEYTNLGQVEINISVGDKTKRTIKAYINVIAVNLTEDSQTIAVSDQVAVHPGETIDIDVLDNDITAGGSSILLDPRMVSDQDTSKEGFAFPVGDKIRYLAPIDATPGSVLTRDYWVYVRGHSQTERAHGYINIVIADPSVKIADSYSGQNSPDDEEQVQQNLQETESTAMAQPVGFYNIVYGALNEDVRVNPLDNDVIPNGEYAKIVKAKLLPPEGANNSMNSREITDENQLKNLSLKVGEAGNPTIWEMTIDVYSDGTLTKYGTANSKVTTYSERVVLRTAREKNIPDYPQFKDTKVKTSEIQHRQTYSTSVDKQLAYTASADSFNYSVVVGDAKVSGTNFSGNMSFDSQIVLFKASLKNSDIATYGFVRVPSLSLVIPTKKSNEIKQVTVGKDPLSINIPNEIEPLDGASLQVDNEVVHEKMRPQSTCQLQGDNLIYTPNKMQGETVDTHLSDVCGVYVQWQGENNTKTLINFQIQIIPEVTEPEIKDGVALADLAPKEESTTDLFQYLSWWGHSDDEIRALQVSCSIDNEVQIGCTGLSLKLTVPRTATELIEHKITIQVLNHQTKPVTWSMRVKAAVKLGNIVVPAPSDTIVIEEGKGGKSFDALTQVKNWLARPEFYDFQTGGTVTCLANQDPKVNCEDKGNGQLFFTIKAEASDTGFMAVGRYQFTDRAPDNNPNKGTGTVNIDYRALPKQPAQPQLDMEAAKNGELNFTVAEASASVPESTAICLVVDGNEMCKPHTENGSQTWSNADLASLAKWQTHSFRAEIKNSVGSSPLSEEIQATPYNKLGSPTVKWKPNTDDSVDIIITNPDPQTATYEITGAAKATIQSSGDKTTYNIPNLNPLELNTVSVQAVSHQVSSGKETFIASRSEIVAVEVVVPHLKTFPGEIVGNYTGVNNNPDMSFGFQAGILAAPKGIEYQYKWEGDCYNDSDWVDLDLSKNLPNATCTKDKLYAFTQKDVSETLNMRIMFNKDAFGGQVDESFSGNGVLFDPVKTSTKLKDTTVPTQDEINSAFYYCVDGNDIFNPSINIKNKNKDNVNFLQFPYGKYTFVMPTIPHDSNVSSVKVHLTLENSDWEGGDFTIPAPSNVDDCTNYAPTMSRNNWDDITKLWTNNFIMTYKMENANFTYNPGIINIDNSFSIQPQNDDFKWTIRDNNNNSHKTGIPEVVFGGNNNGVIGPFNLGQTFNTKNEGKINSYKDADGAKFNSSLQVCLMFSGELKQFGEHCSLLNSSLQPDMSLGTPASGEPTCRDHQNWDKDQMECGEIVSCKVYQKITQDSPGGDFKCKDKDCPTGTTLNMTTGNCDEDNPELDNKRLILKNTKSYAQKGIRKRNIYKIQKTKVLNTKIYAKEEAIVKKD